MMVPSSVCAVTCSSDSGNPSRSITRLWYLAARNGVVGPCSRAPRHHAQQAAKTQPTLWQWFCAEAHRGMALGSIYSARGEVSIGLMSFIAMDLMAVPSPSDV